MKYLFRKTSDSKLPTRGRVLNNWTNTNHSDQRINMEREYHFKGTLWQLKRWEEQIAKELFLITSAVFSLPFEAPPGWACRKVRVLHTPLGPHPHRKSMYYTELLPVRTKDQLLKSLFLKFILHVPPRSVGLISVSVFTAWLLYLATMRGTNLPWHSFQISTSFMPIGLFNKVFLYLIPGTHFKWHWTSQNLQVQDSTLKSPRVEYAQGRGLSLHSELTRKQHQGSNQWSVQYSIFPSWQKHQSC